MITLDCLGQKCPLPVIALARQIGKVGIGDIVLVGWSAGGIYAHEYYRQFPDRVKGMVLVDSSHEQQLIRIAHEAVTNAVVHAGTMLTLGVAVRAEDATGEGGPGATISVTDRVHGPLPPSVEGDMATVGISSHAQEALGDIVFAEVPEAGRRVNKGQEAAVVESVKAASDVYAPVTGEVIEGNQAVTDDPALVNSDPEGEGWFFKLKLDNPGELDGLMDEGSYREWIKTL